MPLPWTICTQWLPNLVNSELKIYCFLLERTLGYNKGWEAISISQFSSGIKNKTGKTLTRGTGLSHTTVTEALTSLAKKGLIQIQRRHKHVSQYRILMPWAGDDEAQKKWDSWCSYHSQRGNFDIAQLDAKPGFDIAQLDAQIEL